ncbi:uncharacterized protein BCR38DRAFT_406234 [Pseudomassariella vexata]|uniref:Uncharacterized protein n=1 Tax=Pseudomassariella vexata TaxID=1141098 RepID=A0A1Y2E9P8_9PEZI|nr:uncharacterized protein BCR38DRAFT_406234 [Pseudomassariella vexata]ORY68293.1 hypothetical protein BCR38DRAFT_406234 [Pseudomassariella vexata]
MTTSNFHTPPIITSTIGGFPNLDRQPPLLTLFTPPGDCAHQWYYDPEIEGTVWSDSRHHSAWNICQPYSVNAYYTPGICPSGQEFKRVINFVFPQGDVTDTFYEGYCCTSDFSMVEFTKGYPICVSTFKAGLTARLTATETVSGYARESSTVLESVVTAVGAYVVIVWHQNDTTQFPESLQPTLRVAMGLAPFLSSSTTSTISQVTTSTPIFTPTHATTTFAAAGAAEMSHSSRPGVSPGVIAGICIGTVAVLVLLATLGFFALRRRWKTPESTMEPDLNSNTTGSRLSWIKWWKKGTKNAKTPPNIPEMEASHSTYKHFSGGAWRGELQGAVHARNLSEGSQHVGGTWRNELPGHGGHSRNLSEGSQHVGGMWRNELPVYAGGSHGHSHSRNPSDGSQGGSYYSGSTASSPWIVEMEGSVPVRGEAIPEVGEDGVVGQEVWSHPRS